MNAKCPHCGANYEVTESELGTQADCIECGRTFVVGDDASHLPSSIPSIHTSLDSVGNKDSVRNKIRNYLKKTWHPKNGTDVDVTCPHCGTAFDTQQGDFGKSHVCKGCNVEFNIPKAYICPNDGNIEWDLFPPLTSFLEEYRWVVIGVAWGFLSWAFWSVSTASRHGSLSSWWRLTFFESIVMGLFEIVASVLKTWQGIVAVVLWCIASAFKDMSRHKCSKCNKKLLDINSPMGWKLYKELYCNN